MNNALVFLMSAILALGTAVGPAAANPTGPTSAAVQPVPVAQGKPHELRLNLNFEPFTADPGLASDSASVAIVRATFDGLMRYGPDGKLQPSLAEQVQISEDGLTYTFTLRQAKWSNGEPVTAHDFAYAWKRVLDPRTNADYAYQLYAVANAEEAHKGEMGLEQVGVKALDHRTLQVKLAQPAPYFLELTTFPTYYPVNRKAVESNPGWAAQASTHVGNGPFLIKVWDHGTQLVLVKNPHYWDKDAVKLERIQFWMVHDAETALAMFQNGELDWAGEPLGWLPPDAVQVLEQEGKLMIRPIDGIYWYKFNTERPPFNNVKIRKAFAYAINRQAVVDQVTQTGEWPALGIVPPSMPLKREGYFRDGDVTTAKQLLAEGMKELGIKELPPITLSYNTGESHQRIAEAVRDQWKQHLGVTVNLVNQEWFVHLEKLRAGDFQIARLGWLGDFHDPVNFLELFKDKYGTNNDTRWSHPDYQKWLEASALERDPAKRKELLARAEQLLLDEMPVIPLYYYTDAFVKHERVSGVVIDGLGFIDFKWADAK